MKSQRKVEWLCGHTIETDDYGFEDGDDEDYEEYYPTKEEIDAEIAADIKAVQLYEITIEHMSGKQIHEK